MPFRCVAAAECAQPLQVNTSDGAAVITIEPSGEVNDTALSQQWDGSVWNVSKAYRSGLVDSWNKFW